MRRRCDCPSRSTDNDLQRVGASEVLDGIEAFRDGGQSLFWGQPRHSSQQNAFNFNAGNIQIQPLDAVLGVRCVRGEVLDPNFELVEDSPLSRVFVQT